MSLNDSLIISRSALLAHQRRMAVIGHNIANVNTDAYHKQNAKLGTNSPIYRAGFAVGTGVKVSDIARAYNQMKETMLLGQKSASEYHSEKANALANLEALIAGTDDASLSARFQEFWNAWQDVANNADNLAFRHVLLERATSLTDHIKILSTRLSNFRDEIADGSDPGPYTGIVATEIIEVNSITIEIRDINKRIATMPTYSSNDLMDRRDLLIRELSEKANITVAADFTISIKGEVIVSGDGVTQNDLVQTSSGSIAFKINGNVVTISSGSLGAWTDVATEVDSLSAKLDTIATELIGGVNDLHIIGYDLDGNTGINNFFTGTGASNIAVNISDPRLIAAAATVYGVGEPNTGDGANALTIAQLAHATPAGLDNQTFEEYFSSAVVSLGTTVQSEQNLAADGASVIAMLLNSIQEETGVNIDEEMIDMISAQRAYEAAARLTATIDDMMDTIINRM